jgi:hypothetical protein
MEEEGEEKRRRRPAGGGKGGDEGLLFLWSNSRWKRGRERGRGAVHLLCA